MKYYLLAAAAAFSMSGAAAAQSMSLNTGYNYTTFNLYLQPTGASNIQDNYWIKIASYEPPLTSVPISAAWVLNPSPPGWSVITGARWVGPQPTSATSGGTTSATNPGYSIYRKCFCLMPNYQNPTLSFRMRADNESNAWLNSITNVLVPPSPDSYGSSMPLLASQPTTPAMFRAGLNCIYVLVQNRGGPSGFSLAGTVTATGLMPTAGAGAGNSFAPCQCGGPAGPVPAGAASNVRMADASDDRATVSAIVAYAEAQRRRAATPR